MPTDYVPSSTCRPFFLSINFTSLHFYSSPSCVPSQSINVFFYLPSRACQLFRNCQHITSSSGPLPRSSHPHHSASVGSPDEALACMGQPNQPSAISIILHSDWFQLLQNDWNDGLRDAASAVCLHNARDALHSSHISRSSIPSF